MRTYCNDVGIYMSERSEQYRISAQRQRMKHTRFVCVHAYYVSEALYDESQ